MKYPLTTALAALLSGFLLLPQAARGTNGYWAHGHSPKSKAMAGAGAALPLDAMDAAKNPATMVLVGNRMDVGVAAFRPERGFQASNDCTDGFRCISPGDFESKNSDFYIPHFARNWMLDSSSSLGLSIGANGGMNTEYDSAIFSAVNNPGGTASSPTGIDFKQLFIGLTYSRKIADHHSFGVTPILAGQSFKVTGLEPFQAFSQDPEHVTNNSFSYASGGGLKIGWLSKITENFSAGISYQSRLWMERFDEYRGLFAEQGSFDIPPNLIGGVAWQVSPSLTLVLDAQRIFFEEVDTIANGGHALFQPGAILLGTDDGIGFGWQDMTIGKVGLQWQWRPDLTLRAGYSLADQVIPENQTLFNLLAPAVVTEHYTLGLTKFFNNIELDLSFMYAPEENVSGNNPNTGMQTRRLEMKQFEIGLNLGFVF